MWWIMKTASLMFFIFLTQIAFGQKSYYKAYAKIDSTGNLKTRIVTLDSLEIEDIKNGKLSLQISKNNQIVASRNLKHGTIEELAHLVSIKPAYYLLEFYDILTDPEQPATIDAAYQILVFLSHFDFDAATWLGLGTTETINPGNYEIKYILTKKGGKPKLIASVSITADDWKKSPPTPEAPQLTCGNKKVDIELFAKNCNFYYWGFNAQRKKTGENNWEFINPTININTYYEEKYRDGRFLYKLKDSLPENNITYEYRMIGKDYFGDYGPASPSSACMGYEAIPAIAIPEINSMANDSVAELTWSIRDIALPYLNSVDLMISIDSLHGNYIPYIENLDLDNKKFTALIPGSSAYFRYKTIPKYGPAILSSPFVIQRWDTEAPAAPVGLKGEIDSLGIVRINWLPNTEKDLWGYRVFYSNNKTDEFSLSDVEIQLNPEYIDTIKLNNLSPEIYYKIVALDLRGNISPFSKILTIEKPDTIPPSPALIQLIKQYKNTRNLLIRAIGSSSADISFHALYRKEIDQKDYTNISLLGKMPQDTVIVDTSAQFDHQYEYRILAVDKHQNKSWSEISDFEVIFFGARPALKTISAFLDTIQKKVLIEWKNHGLANAEIEIYRSNERDDYTLYYKAPVSAVRWIDDQYDLIRKPQYKARVIYNDGTYSNLFEIPITKKPFK